MKHNVVAACALAAATLISTHAFALDETGNWMVRARAVQLNSANSDSTGLGLSINNKTIPEADVSYFFTKNLAAELILTVPQSQTLYSNGTSIGSLKHLPPTLTVQYHFDLPSFRPYVGAGVNYTHFSSFSTIPAITTALSPSISSNSFGGAVQVGVDIPLAKSVYLNFDVKKVYLGTKVSSFGKQVGTFNVNPLLVGAGIGYRF